MCACVFVGLGARLVYNSQYKVDGDDFLVVQIGQFKLDANNDWVIVNNKFLTFDMKTFFTLIRAMPIMEQNVPNLKETEAARCAKGNDTNQIHIF